MKIPNGHRADLGTKLEEYVLNPSHREGKHKARVFESVLGINESNRDLLERAILNAVAQSSEAESRGNNGYGQCFVLRLSMTTAKGSAVILTAWIIVNGEDFPRLTTCYIV